MRQSILIFYQSEFHLFVARWIVHLEVLKGEKSKATHIVSEHFAETQI